MRGFNKALVGGSLTLLVMFNLFNILNFLFQFSMARILSVAEYGIIATLFSLIYILGIPTESIQMIITKYSSQEREKGKLKNILKKSFSKSLLYSFFIFIAYIILSFVISPFLKIPSSLLIVTGLMIFPAFTVPIFRGLLQGKKRFNALGINVVSEGALKLIAGIVLVLGLTSLGFLSVRVYGAIFAAILGSFVALPLSFYGLKDILKSREEKSQTFGIYNYAKPTFTITLIIFLFFSLDIILAKVFFSPELAGAYAIASVLGKVIFLGTQPISRAMFPLSAEKSKDEKESKKILSGAFLIISVCIALALIVVFLFAEQIVGLFSGKEVLEASSILFYVSIAAGFLSLANLNLLYKLSISKTKGYAYLLIFVLIEIGLLGYFSGSLAEFSLAFIVSSAVFFIGSFFLMGK